MSIFHKILNFNFNSKLEDLFSCIPMSLFVEKRENEKNKNFRDKFQNLGVTTSIKNLFWMNEKEKFNTITTIKIDLSHRFYVVQSLSGGKKAETNHAIGVIDVDGSEKIFPVNKFFKTFSGQDIVDFNLSFRLQSEKIKNLSYEYTKTIDRNRFLPQSIPDGPIRTF